MRILVCGDREWTDREAIARVLRVINQCWLLEGSSEHEAPTLIHGACRGADRLAGKEAEDLGWTVDPYPADWSVGRHAGVLRNQLMLDDGQPDLVLAFHPNLTRSKGTADMVRRAREAGIPTEVFPV